VVEFAQLDRMIYAEKDQTKRNGLFEARQNKLNELEIRLMQPILEECKQVIKTVMNAKKMTVLLEVDSVYAGGTDITDDVIRKMGDTLKK
jgi:Skp family chaperone for outer membrane proteins